MAKKLSPLDMKSKVKILECFSRGLNATQIMAKVPGYSRQQIAAIMAWKTMEKNPARKNRDRLVCVKVPRNAMIAVLLSPQDRRLDKLF